MRHITGEQRRHPSLVEIANPLHVRLLLLRGTPTGSLDTKNNIRNSRPTSLSFALHLRRIYGTALPNPLLFAHPLAFPGCCTEASPCLTVFRPLRRQQRLGSACAHGGRPLCVASRENAVVPTDHYCLLIRFHLSSPHLVALCIHRRVRARTAPTTTVAGSSCWPLGPRLPRDDHSRTRRRFDRCWGHFVQGTTPVTRSTLPHGPSPPELPQGMRSCESNSSPWQLPALAWVAIYMSRAARRPAACVGRSLAVAWMPPASPIAQARESSAGVVIVC